MKKLAVTQKTRLYIYRNPNGKAEENKCLSVKAAIMLSHSLGKVLFMQSIFTVSSPSEACQFNVKK